jgi:lysophospholipase L1-like esterase
MAYPTPYPYPNTVPNMDLSAPNAIFHARAASPGVALPGEGPVLVIGDSLCNQLPESYSAHGRNVLRYAVNGMRGHDVIPSLGLILEWAQPSVVVVVLGKNDQGTTPGTGLDTGLGQYWYWQQDYWWIVKYIVDITAAQGRPVLPVLMTILPCESTAPAPWNNPPLFQWYSAYVQSVGSAQGCQVVDFAAPAGTYPGVAAITNPTYVVPGFTSDGIHPTGASQALFWAYIQHAIGLGLTQAGLPLLTTPPAIP